MLVDSEDPVKRPLKPPKSQVQIEFNNPPNLIIHSLPPHLLLAIPKRKHRSRTKSVGRTRKLVKIGMRVMMRMMMELLGMISKLPMRPGICKLEEVMKRRRKGEKGRHGLLKMEVRG
jgi:hypothetical protein